ncbi:unnamed protein product [Protopolystoma xenopodis]|uniref:Uncharacterized protein n=1 Tax=Protopolystoma xenopodis TaxID=117903 RepID=A0A3S5B345_9PLAT|nr:unnamed protein product [Protopolystoma xenopodis]
MAHCFPVKVTASSTICSHFARLGRRSLNQSGRPTLIGRNGHLSPRPVSQSRCGSISTTLAAGTWSDRLYANAPCQCTNQLTCLADNWHLPSIGQPFSWELVFGMGGPRQMGPPPSLVLTTAGPIRTQL